MNKYVAIVEITDQEKRQEVRPKHLAYLRSLVASGKLHAAGPLADGGSMSIYNAETEEEARTLLANDPYSQAGIIGQSTLRGWTLVLSEPND